MDAPVRDVDRLIGAPAARRVAKAASGLEDDSADGHLFPTEKFAHDDCTSS